jgi:NADPH:quinone reductase
MKAAVVKEPGKVQLCEVSMPEPDAHHVRIRLEGSGVCASSLPVFQGRPWFQYPLAPGLPGHEGWGVVDAVGAQVTRVRAGDRVTGLTYHAFAEYDVVAEDAVVPLPAALAGVPFPGEALGCAMNIFRRAQVSSGQHVAIVGIGFLGAALVQLATRAGASVVAVSRRASSLELARRMGAKHLVSMGQSDAVAEVRRLTGGVGAECVIEAVGEQGPLDLATALTAERGRLVIAGYHQDGLRQVDMQLWNWRGLDVINAHERAASAYVQGIRDAVSAVIEGHLDPRPFYTHVYSLADVSAALLVQAHRPEGFVKALVVTS